MKLITAALIVSSTAAYIAALVYIIKLLGRFVRENDEIYKDSENEK